LFTPLKLNYKKSQKKQVNHVDLITCWTCSTPLCTLC